MKFLLTSSGLTNTSIVQALQNLVVKPFADLKIAFIPTAANLEASDKSWLVKNLEQFRQLNPQSLDIVDISAVPQKIWQPRLETADILVVGGGNTFHLMAWMIQSGLQTMLPKILQTKVYVGISAGSNVTTPSLATSRQDRKKIVEELGEVVSETGLGLVDFMIQPHINSSHFPTRTLENLKKAAENFAYPVYGIDDQSAVQVVDGKETVISEGVWKKFS